MNKKGNFNKGWKPKKRVTGKNTIVETTEEFLAKKGNTIKKCPALECEETKYTKLSGR